MKVKRGLLSAQVLRGQGVNQPLPEDGRFTRGTRGLIIWTLLLASPSKNMIVTTLVLDRDKTLRGMKQRESGQAYLDGLVLNYNYFRPHQALDGKKPAESAGAVIPFESWRDVASMTETSNQALARAREIAGGVQNA